MILGAVLPRLMPKKFFLSTSVWQKQSRYDKIRNNLWKMS